MTNNTQRASFRQRIGVYLDILRENGIDYRVAPLPSGSLARWKLFKQAADFDGVFLHKKRLNPLDAFWLRRNARKVIYDFDDAVMYDDKNPDKPSRKRRNSFRRTVKLADIVIASNAYLAEHAKSFNKNVEVIATALDVKDYEQNVCKPDDGKIRLVWIGSKSTLKYLVGISDALEEIGSRFDNVILRIICDDFFDLQNMEVEKCRWSLERQIVDLAESDIGLSPLPSDRFTRGKSGGFKILQYAAAGLPVVAGRDVNAKGIQEGINGFLAGNSADWVGKISRLLGDSQLRKQMGRAGRIEVQQFDLHVIGNQLCELLKRCLEDIGPSDSTKASMVKSCDVACDFCGSVDADFLFTAKDRLYGCEGSFTYVKCRNCGLTYMNPQIASDEIGKFYPDDYAPHRSKTDSGSRPQTTKLKNILLLRSFRKRFLNNVKITASVRRKLKKQSRLLDVGCGSGSFLDRIRRNTGCQVYGVDFSESAVKAAREAYGIDVFKGPITEAPFPANSFDVITAWWYLEHVGNPSEVLRKMHSLLGDDGYCIIGVPNIDSFNARIFKDKWYHLDSPRHLYIYSPDTITKLLDEAGFVATKKVFGKEPRGLLYSLRYCFGDDSIPLKRRKRLKGSSLLKKLLLPWTILLALLKQSDTFVVYARKKCD